MWLRNTVFLGLVFLLLISSFNVAFKVEAVTETLMRKPDAATTAPWMLRSLSSPDPTFPGQGVKIGLFGNSSVRYVNSSDYFYVMHGWVTDNWSSYDTQVQNAFLDPKQSNFTLETTAPGFLNPPMTQFTYYDNSSGTDTMSSYFWFQFFPGNLAPGNYSFTGTWMMAGAANPPNYTDIYSQRTVTLDVLISTSTMVTCSPSSVSIATPATCTANVSGYNPTGNVTWSTSSNTGSFGSPIGTLSSGFCSTSYVDNASGYVTITASYSGDSNYGPSSGTSMLTVFVNMTVGENVTVSPVSGLGMTFADVTTAGYVVANETLTAPVPVLTNLVGQFCDIKVTAAYSGNVTVSLAFDGSNMTLEQKNNLTMVQYTPISGDVRAPFGTVDMRDIGFIARQFGTTNTSPNWDPAADITGPTYLVPDGKVDMRDVGLAARNFGRTSQWIPITTYVDTTKNIIYGNTTHFSLIGIH